MLVRFRRRSVEEGPLSQNVANAVQNPEQSHRKQQAWDCRWHGRSKGVSNPGRRRILGALTACCNVGPTRVAFSAVRSGSSIGSSRELYDETDDGEYGRDAHTHGQQGRPDGSAPVVGMGAPRGVDPERGEQNDASRRSGYGRPKKPVHGLSLNTAQAPLACRSAGQRCSPRNRFPKANRFPRANRQPTGRRDLAPRSASQAVTPCAGVPAAGVINWGENPGFAASIGRVLPDTSIRSRSFTGIAASAGSHLSRPLAQSHSHFRFSLMLGALPAAVATCRQFGASKAAEIPANR